jgi:hypothetical protein
MLHYFASDLLAGCFPKDRCVLVVEISVFSVPYVATITEIRLSASIGNLIPEWGVGGQPVKQTLPIPVAGCFSSVGIRSLWPVAHTVYYIIDYFKCWDYDQPM